MIAQIKAFENVFQEMHGNDLLREQNVRKTLEERLKSLFPDVNDENNS